MVTTAAKLGIAPGATVNLVAPPPAWQIPDLSPEVVVADMADGLGLREPGHATREDIVIAFFRRAAEVGDGIREIAPIIYPDGALWALWPRRAGGHSSDVTDNVVRAAALERGLVDNKVAAVDDDWSGLRIVWRSELRRSPESQR